MKTKSFFYPLVIIFLLLTILVGRQVLRPVDFQITAFIQKFGTKELDYFFYFFTLLGSVEFTCFVLLIVSWYVRQKYQWPGVFLYLFFFMLLTLVELIWKHVVCYVGPGPEFNRNPFHLNLISIITPYSFPSGHAFRTAFLLGIWYQWIKILSGSARSASVQRISIFTLFILIGVSRVYLGDHWVSDVIGGYLLAAIGLCLISDPMHPELRPA